MRLPEVPAARAAKGTVMSLVWLSRCFFALVAALAFAVVLSGTACTRWGQPGPILPSLAPLSALYVNPVTGSDSSGNGTASKPYKTLTKAIAVLSSAKLAASGVTIYLAGGQYTAANGEKFPIVVPTAVTISGTNFGGGPHAGTFINGFGEDTLLELLLHEPRKSNYSTMDVAAGADVSLNDVYVAAANLRLPNARAAYAAMDVIGTLSGTTVGLGIGVATNSPAVTGVVIPGGTFSCDSCLIHGNAYGVAALSVTLPTTSPTTSPTASSTPNSGPSITLTHSVGDSTISAKLADIFTDGSVSVTASNQHFEQSQYAFADTLHPIVNVGMRGAIDFGGGVAKSVGGNTFLGARTSEILVGRTFEKVVALDNVWNVHQQGANGSGLYKRTIVFKKGATGKNVTIRSYSDGATVTVGPAPAPTPTPSSTPSSSPSPSPTP